jgi:hypothetical protein
MTRSACRRVTSATAHSSSSRSQAAISTALLMRMVPIAKVTRVANQGHLFLRGHHHMMPRPIYGYVPRELERSGG